MSDPKSKLVIWAAKNGKGDYSKVFTEKFATNEAGQFICTISKSKPTISVSGRASVGKKATRLDACTKMLKAIEEASGKSLQVESGSFGSGVYKSNLCEWTRKNYNLNFSQMFRTDSQYTPDGLQISKITIIPLKDSLVPAKCFTGEKCPTRKQAEHSACKYVWEYLESLKTPESKKSVDPPCRYEALLGNLLLRYMAVREQYKSCRGEKGTSELKRDIASLTNKNRLRQYMHKVGLQRTADEVLDSLRIEQWIWKQYLSAGSDYARTRELILPLLQLDRSAGLLPALKSVSMSTKKK